MNVFLFPIFYYNIEMVNSIQIAGIIFLIVVVVGIIVSWILDRKSKTRRMESNNPNHDFNKSEKQLEQARTRGHEDYQRNLTQVISSSKTFKGI